ncbi:MAG: hypothetical protein CVU44_14840 [Chloroflexi bacterium HGW-Chloroflexi-6]|nr:MAG: hypothetical protein CVU44_14840 [Chloroflexi bacterium HGW-Chloroflexi-6]
MCEISNNVDELIKLGFAPLLKTYRFRKSGRTFYRQVDEIWQVLNVQSSQSNFGLIEKFTINLGIYHPIIAQLAGKSFSTGYPKEYECTIRKRIGHLMQSQGDYWWEIDPSTNLEVLAKQVNSTVEEFGLPWLETHCDLRVIANTLSEQPSIMSAAAALALGDKLMAQQRLARMIIERPMAANTARSWANKQGLET